MHNSMFRSRDRYERRSRLCCLLSCALALIVPVSQAAAQADSPMLYPKGKVIVDGKEAGRPMALFPGEKVQTAPGASASLTALGSSVLLSPNTSLTYDNNTLQIGCGDVLVTTAVKRMAASVANLNIVANSDVAKYQITRSNGKLEIASREGSINVNDGVQTTSLDAGKVLSFSAGNDCPLDASSDQAQAPASK